jgi:hypothetical protein
LALEFIDSLDYSVFLNFSVAGVVWDARKLDEPAGVKKGCGKIWETGGIGRGKARSFVASFGPTKVVP